MPDHLDEFQNKMRHAGLSESVIRSFAAYYLQLIEGVTGKLGRDAIDPPNPARIVEYSDLPVGDPADLIKLAIVKLNGGLGTGMGLSRAKSLLPVKNGLNFLDIIARQTMLLRQRASTPLMFMNSYSTRDDTLAFLKKYPELKVADLPLDFVQNKYPRVRAEDFAPLALNDDEQNWNPPGHGDIYLTMAGSGVLDRLLELGYEYLFVSNSDNLGAVADERILSHFARNRLPFMMEVCRRTESDRKGGHLAETKTGRLVLRESAQCPELEIGDFQDIEVFRFFNTNNLWINLIALKERMDASMGMLHLPIILNPKTVEGVKILQVETAMGSAISVFEGAGALEVPRSRFAPVKKCDDLLAIWSDAYVLTDDHRIMLHPDRTDPPAVLLDERFFKSVDQLSDRCAGGIPSLLRCERLNLIGDVRFGAGVEFEGVVTLEASEPTTLQDEVFIGEVRLP
jgi:UTP--glucose-1-phosphate uridylyltransferase